MNIKPLKLNTLDKDFQKNFFKRIKINSSTNKKIHDFVNNIITNIKKKGDTSLISYIKKYDGYNIRNIKTLDFH